MIEEVLQINIGLVGAQLKKYGMLEDPDAYCVGMEALYKATLTFEPFKENSSSFSTYATVCVYNRLGSYLRSQKTMLNQQTFSYDIPTSETGSTYLDTLEADCCTEAHVVITEELNEVLHFLNKYCSESANETQQQILRMWANSDFEISNVAIATALNCSQSYVSQVIKAFRIKLKIKMEGLNETDSRDYISN